MNQSRRDSFLRAMALIASGEVTDPAGPASAGPGDMAAFSAGVRRTMKAAEDQAIREHFAAGPRVPDLSRLLAAFEAFVDEIFWLHGIERPKSADDGA